MQSAVLVGGSCCFTELCGCFVSRRRLFRQPKRAVCGSLTGREMCSWECDEREGLVWDLMRRYRNHDQGRVSGRSGFDKSVWIIVAASPTRHTFFTRDSYMAMHDCLATWSRYEAAMPGPTSLLFLMLLPMRRNSRSMLHAVSGMLVVSTDSTLAAVSNIAFIYSQHAGAKTSSCDDVCLRAKDELE
ncbi:hypothetical protein DE146DRAFT_160334 [Phaeosphaeria sp. MPI-PUGE-AT-0046c]|nr:hypothetical protein DE146DRAFT_160334 [Phaeosphaeria sp. MPI-PUGE-AT-0046c]